MTTMIDVAGLSKTFTLHNQDGIRLPVLNDVSLHVNAGECLVLQGPSGTGKSTLLRTLYANYLPTTGRVAVRHQGTLLDLTTSSERQRLAVRHQTLGYVSQFLRVIPRVSALNVVKQPLRDQGVDNHTASSRAAELLERLHIPAHLWQLPPSTFSGGEQQRINIARGFAYDKPVLLLDEPTASLDRTNSAVVVELIKESLARGAAVVGIFHDTDVRDAVADRIYEVKPPISRPNTSIEGDDRDPD